MSRISLTLGTYVGCDLNSWVFCCIDPQLYEPVNLHRVITISQESKTFSSPLKNLFFI